MSGDNPSSGKGLRGSTAASLESNVNSEWHSANRNNRSVRYRDQAHNLTPFKNLKPTDIILLLTPAVPPRPDDFEEDPFEYLGRALLSRHQKGRYMKGQPSDGGEGSGQESGGELGKAMAEHQRKGQGAVAHFPYTDKNLLTSSHRAAMKLSSSIILVSNHDNNEEHRHHHAALAAIKINNDIFGDSRGVTLVLTNNAPGAFDLVKALPTVIQTEDYSKESLDTIAGIVFGEIGTEDDSANPVAP